MQFKELIVQLGLVRPTSQIYRSAQRNIEMQTIHFYLLHSSMHLTYVCVYIIFIILIHNAYKTHELGGFGLAVWINVVALRRARLVLGWVTVCGRVNHLNM